MKLTATPGKVIAIGRQQQGLKEPDQDADPVKHQKDAQEPGKGFGLVDQVAEREQPRAKGQLAVTQPVLLLPSIRHGSIHFDASTRSAG